MEDPNVKPFPAPRITRTKILGGLINGPWGFASWRPQASTLAWSSSSVPCSTSTATTCAWRRCALLSTDDRSRIGGDERGRPCPSHMEPRSRTPVVIVGTLRSTCVDAEAALRQARQSPSSGCAAQVEIAGRHFTAIRTPSRPVCDVIAVF